jgi:two-component system, NarL family, sensor histidine kinase DesK
MSRRTWSSVGCFHAEVGKAGRRIMSSATIDVSAGSDWALDRDAAPVGWYVAPRLARTLVVVVFAGLATVPLLRILAQPDPGALPVLAVGFLLAVLAVQLRFLGRHPPSYRSLAGIAALLAQAALAYLPFLQLGPSWAGMPGFLAGSCLLALPRIAGWTSFVAVVASTAGVLGTLTGDPLEIAYSTAATAVNGLLVYGLIRLAALVEELGETRADVARLAVAGERLRVSRDLHDILGSSISAITLKGELTARLIRTSPDRACAEMSEVLDLSRRALADVRSVARGYRELSLLEEALVARSILQAAGVRVRIAVSGIDQLPRDVETVLGIVLREGVTNVLRHSDATICELAIRPTGDGVQLEIVNDGAAGSRSEDPDGGSGLHSLSARMAALSGRLTTGTLPGDRWRLCATVTLVPPC